ncbi:MAG: hypothetical protein MJE66_05335 [Proteobacteria bacterium]|nr:hypothetical protein [Pseudomonadota bacterium]
MYSLWSRNAALSMLLVYPALSCGADSARAEPLETWLPKSIAFFRTLGFFEGAKEVSDDELGRRLAEKHRQEWGEALDPDYPLADLLLVRFDARRVWWEDTEADVYSGNTVYVDTLKRLGAISRGTFSPTSITERWASEEGPITVSFQHKGELITLRPEVMRDYLDLRILLDINRVIEKSGIQFELYEAFDQTAFIVALKPQEKHRLSKERNWRFAY